MPASPIPASASSACTGVQACRRKQKTEPDQRRAGEVEREERTDGGNDVEVHREVLLEMHGADHQDRKPTERSQECAGAAVFRARPSDYAGESRPRRRSRPSMQVVHQ